MADLRTAARVLSTLRPLLHAERWDRLVSVAQQRCTSVSLCLEHPDQDTDVAACVRTAEINGLQNVHVFRGPGQRLRPRSARRAVLSSVSKGTHLWLSTHLHDSSRDWLQSSLYSPPQSEVVYMHQQQQQQQQHEREEIGGSESGGGGGGGGGVPPLVVLVADSSSTQSMEQALLKAGAGLNSNAGTRPTSLLPPSPVLQQQQPHHHHHHHQLLCPSQIAKAEVVPRVSLCFSREIRRIVQSDRAAMEERIQREMKWAAAAAARDEAGGRGGGGGGGGGGGHVPMPQFQTFNLLAGDGAASSVSMTSPLFPLLPSEPSFKLSIAVALSIQRLDGLSMIPRLGRLGPCQEVVAPLPCPSGGGIIPRLDEVEPAEAARRRLALLGFTSSEIDTLDGCLLPEFPAGILEHDARAQSLLLASWLMTRVAHGREILEGSGVSWEDQQALTQRVALLQG